MSKNETDLYYACSHFCDAFFHLMCTKDEVNSHRLFGSAYDEDSLRAMLRFDEQRVQHSLQRLKEAIKKVEDDRK